VTGDAAEARFVASLSADVPPPGLTPALRGEWDLAHDAVQPDDRDCAWVHAALHRDEGDLPNARYWYAEAGRRLAPGPVRDEYLAILRVLLAAG